MQHINCGWCSTTFVKKNSLHKFCSPACKKKSWRKDNSKPEFPTFISKPTQPKTYFEQSSRQSYVTPTPSIPVDEIIEEVKRPVRKVRRIVTQLPVIEKKEPVTSKNPLRDAKEKKVMDTLMEAFDDMLLAKNKEETELGYHSKKEIAKKIVKLESKRKKVIKQVNKLNAAIRKKVNRISKQINKGIISNSTAQFKIDSIRDEEVKNLVEIVKNRDWILMYDEHYYFA